MGIGFVVPGFLLAALLAASAHGGGFLVLKNGTIVRGHMIAVTPDSVTGIVEPDSVEKTIRRDEVEPQSWYTLRSITAGVDAESRLELARFCLANDLYPFAEEELHRVIALDETKQAAAQKLIDEARSKQAIELSAVAEKLEKAGKAAAARRLASRVLTQYSDTAASDRAAAILDRQDQDDAITPKIEKEIAAPLTDAQVDKMRESDPRYQELKKDLEIARARHRSALKGKSQSAQKTAFEESVRSYRQALAMLDRVEKEEAAEPVIVERVKKFRVMLLKEAAEVHENFASFYAARTSFPQAQEQIAEALKLLPNDPALAGTRAHIQTLEATYAQRDRWGGKRR